MPSKSEEAEALKVKGNEKYRACAFADAIDFYRAAAALQPKEPVYFSNISAAQFEDGQYANALVSCNLALSLIDSANSNHAALRLKLLIRRSRAFTFLHAEDQTLFAEASAACDTLLIDDTANTLTASQNEALERLRTARNVEAKINRRLADIPRYRCVLKNIREYYTVGHDDANSIFRCQYTSHDDASMEHPYAERFHMKIPRDGTAFDFSAFFCGISDARHVYASLADIADDLSEWDRTCKRNVFPTINIHFTINDVHPSALSRNLIIFTLLSDLSAIPAAEHKKDPRALDLLLALHYAYWGTTMPPHAHMVLEKTLSKVSDAVGQAADQGVALDLKWLYIEPKTVKEINTRLKWWQNDGKTTLSFDEILPERIESDGPRDPTFTNYQLHPQDRTALQSASMQRHAAMIKDMREDPRARAFCKAESEKLGMTPEEYIELVENISPDAFAIHRDIPPNSHVERTAWKYLKVMVPPPHAKEPETLDKVFRVIRSGKAGDSDALLDSPDVLEEAFERIRKRWRVNFTFLDKDWLRDYAGNNANLVHCPFRGTFAMFSPHHTKHLQPTTRKGSIYEWSAQFFSLAADGMARLREHGVDCLKLEIILGDGYAIMEHIRLNILERNPRFPVKFDRIHASNVPDYIGGYLATFTTATPLLKPLPTSYFTNCSMLNAGVWEGGFTDGKHDLNMDSALYTYAAVTRADVSAAYGVSVDCKPVYAANYHTFGRAKPSKLLSRRDLAPVAYACFIKTVLPAKYERHSYAGNVREPLNVRTFFRLMEIFKDQGYPTHALADIVESILENRVTDSPPPHDVVPIPLVSRNKSGKLCTIPFQAEFEVAAAMWEPRLFPICSSLVPATSDILRYSVRLSMVPLPMEHSIPPTHFVLMLVFGSQNDLDGDTTDFRKRVTNTQDCRTSIQLLSTFHYDPDTGVVTFLLSKKRLEKFVKSGFEVAMLNTMFWRIQTRKVPCANIENVGDLDEWDRSRKIVTPQGRALTQREVRGWNHDIMRGCYGPTSTMPWAGNPMMDMLSGMSGVVMNGSPPDLLSMMTSLLRSK